MSGRRRPFKPIFVDHTGRRRRLVRVAGVATGLGLALATLLLVAGFTGAGPGHLPLLPEPAGGAPRAPRPAAVTPPAGSSPAQAPPDDRATPSATPPATAATAAATAAAPTPSRSDHRRVPTHTPGVKPSRPT